MASRSRRGRSALANRGTSRCLCATPTATSSNCAGASRARSRASRGMCRKPAARARRRGLRQQCGVDAVPIGRRRRRLEIGDALLVELIDVLHDLRRLGAAGFELAVRGLPILAAIGVDHRVMRAFEGGEGRRGAHAFVAEQEEDADRLGLADDQNEVDLEHRLAEIILLVCRVICSYSSEKIVAEQRKYFGLAGNIVGHSTTRGLRGGDAGPVILCCKYSEKTAASA